MSRGERVLLGVSSLLVLASAIAYVELRRPAISAPAREARPLRQQNDG